MQSIVCMACACKTARVRVGLRASGTSSSPLRRLVAEASAFGETASAERELQWATQPYAARAGGGGGGPAERERPARATVLLFPGPDAHFVGMGRRLQDVPAARDLYELASSIVGWDVGRVCREGPAEALAARAPAAVLATSLAALEAAREARPGALHAARAAAGYSLGELAALVFAAALPFDRALRLAELYAAAAQAAASARPCGALALRLAADARLGELAARARERAAERGVRAPVCQPAAYLSPGRRLLAGDEEALRFVEEEGRALGVLRCERVRWGGALHSPLLAEAQAAVRAALRPVEARAPRLQVVSCVDARAYGRGAGAGAEVRRRLARLCAAPARWEQVLQALFARPRGEPQPLALAPGPAAGVRDCLRRVNARAWDGCVHIPV